MFLQSFSPNREGRDYVIGDLHGMYDLLFQTLETVSFDYQRDRCFSVGDLIDRGPSSEQCLGLINEPWFHPVCGNHEDTLRFIARNPEPSDVLTDWVLNGGRWHLQVSTVKMHAYADLVDTLPELIEVKTRDGRCMAICHAEFPLSIYQPDKVENNPELREALMWSRAKVHSLDESLVNGIDCIFCGHTIVKEPLLLGNTWFIDTGAFNTQKLTLFPLN